MKKTAAAAMALLFLLSGCTKASGDFASLVNSFIVSAETTPAAKPTYRKDCYAYYCNPSIGRLSADATSNTFLLDGTKFVMNLDVAGIVNAIYYTDAERTVSGFDNLETVYETNGNYIDYDRNEHQFDLKIYVYGNTYVTWMTTAYAEFFGISDAVTSARLSGEMLKIARSVHVNEKAVAALNSLKDDITYTAKRVQLFHNIVPENGLIAELFPEDVTRETETSPEGSVPEETAQP